MGRTMRLHILATVLLCFYINLVVADQRVVRFHRRQDSVDTSSPRAPSRPTAVDASPTINSKTPETSESRSGAEGDPSSTTGRSVSTSSSWGSNSTSTTRSASPTQVSVSAVTSNINGPAETDSYNHAIYNSTATPGLLPIAPEITPGFAVGGVILILSGLVYTLIGIKNKWLHIFLSGAYLASVSVTVLIIYVMNPPVSNAIQGAYLVAVVMTGLILGGAATVFTEMTEGLGCLLGGFSFSMWLIVLKPGGLITTTGGKSMFIAAFTLAAFATSFSHYTRDYGLIVSISFGGATAVVLGIDCFSRAGLKEFWVYLWDLNTNLFPIGATSYPLTRGMKVEIAAIIIIFLAGIVSQMKLWKVIKERRELRAAERLQDEQTMEQEEEHVGRRIERRNAQERGQWEAVYGDKDVVAVTAGLSKNRDSGVGDMDSQEKGARSTVTSIRRSGEDDIEMSEMASPTLMTGAGLVMSNHGNEGGAVTVRVARELEPLAGIDENRTSMEQQSNRLSHVSARSLRVEQPQEENVWVVGADGEARKERRPSQRNLKRVPNPHISGVPEVVPLPFKIPAQEENAEDDRSSVATFANEDQGAWNRNSRHLSAGSAILRRLSKKSERNSRTFSRGEGISTEDLFIPRAVEADDNRASSAAATMDGLSDDGDMRSIRSSFEKAPDTDEARTPLQLSPGIDVKMQAQELSSPMRPTMKLVTNEPGRDKSQPVSEATEATKLLDPEAPKANKPEGPTIMTSLTSSTDPKPQSKSPPRSSTSEDVTQDTTEKEGGALTVVSVVESNSASITKERLPPQLSKVVMSYRTNEWAKHLSGADDPEVDELKIAEYPLESEIKTAEAAAPVDVDALQQTANNAAPPPAPRSISQMSNLAAPPLPRSQSKRDQSPYQSRPESSNGAPLDLSRNMSQQSINTRAMGFRSSHSAIPQPIVKSPIEESNSTFTSVNGAGKFSPQLTPFGSTTTLIGRRDTMLRSKYSYYGNSPALTSTPEFPSQYENTGPNSDAGSAYNHPNNSTPMVTEDENMPLSARRELIRQSTTLMVPLQQTPVPFDSHQPRRQSSAPSPHAREQQLASWRANVAQDLHSAAIPKHTIERSRSALWQERQAEEHRRAMDAKIRGERDSAFDERMRRGDMLDAHREALRKMQASANQHA